MQEFFDKYQEIGSTYKGIDYLQAKTDIYIC